MIVPNHSIILIEPILVGGKLASGMILPDTAKEIASSEGIVVALGPDVPADRVVIGDTVIHNKFGNVPVRDGDKEYILCDWKNIFAFRN